jgi:hypothetical protein
MRTECGAGTKYEEKETVITENGGSEKKENERKVGSGCRIDGSSSTMRSSGACGPGLGCRLVIILGRTRQSKCCRHNDIHIERLIRIQLR